MLTRRNLFGFLLGAPAAAVVTAAQGKPVAYVPLRNGHHIAIEGAADEKVAVLIDAKLKEANAKLLAHIQRNVGGMSARWNERFGA